MEFNTIVKNILLPLLSNRGFTVLNESKGRIVFSSNRFEVHCSYDFSRSKDFYLRVCNKISSISSECLEDYELIELLNFRRNSYQNLPEDEQIHKFASYYYDLFHEKGDLIFQSTLYMR